MASHTASTSTATRARRSVASPLIAVQVTAVLAVLVLAWQFVTAGQLLPRGGPVALHGGGAIVLHVVTGLLTIAAILRARVGRGPWWPAVVSAGVFALTFVQAWLGEHGLLAFHVPCALLLTLGAVWVTAWSFSPAARS